MMGSSSVPSSAPGTPMSRRRLRQPSQSPALDAQQMERYRTPPSTPFQPAFYKTPKDGLDLSERKYRLPSQSRNVSDCDQQLKIASKQRLESFKEFRKLKAGM